MSNDPSFPNGLNNFPGTRKTRLDDKGMACIRLNTLTIIAGDDTSASLDEAIFPFCIMNPPAPDIALPDARRHPTIARFITDPGFRHGIARNQNVNGFRAVNWRDPIVFELAQEYSQKYYPLSPVKRTSSL